MQRLVAALGTILVGAVMGLGCPNASAFHCQSSEQCQDGARQGVCTNAGYCAFEDESCESDLAYGELAAPELAGSCVPVGGGTGASGEASSDATTTTTTSSSGSGSPATSDETGLPPGCPAGVGGPCEPEDPCALAGTCNADGACVPTGVVTCNAPPGPCYSPQGQCLPDGGCEYPPLPPTSECEDGDPCTVGDKCDDAGTCVPGPACPIFDECQVAECGAEGCVYAPAPNGASCGGASAERCCNGECVDIASDEEHCGGCNSTCAVGQECESVENTSMCDDSPPDTSGRCTCQDADDECPKGQLCRNQLPYTGRCAPSTAMACDGVLVEVDLCPNYCSY